MDDEPLSLPALAREAQVSPSQLRNWTKWPVHPLAGTPAGRSTTHTWAQLRTFVEEHPELPAARKVRRRMVAADRPEGQKGSAHDPETVRAVLSDLRAAASSNLRAAIAAARLAEQTAISHREQLEALASTVNAYDDLLTQLTAPGTLND